MREVLAEPYMELVQSHRLLSSSEEKRYIKRAQGENPIQAKKAKRELVENNQRLVLQIAGRYIDYGLSLADLVQEGNLGLLKAIERFDVSRNLRFSTYATWWVRQAVQRALQNQSRTVRLPVHTQEKLRKVRRTREELSPQLGREAEAADVAEVLDMSEEVVEFLLNPELGSVTSLDRPLMMQGERSTETYSDILEDEAAEDPQDETMSSWVFDLLWDGMSEMKPRERSFFWRHLMEDETLESLSHDSGFREDGQVAVNGFGSTTVSRERVRQIKKKAALRLIDHIMATPEFPTFGMEHSYVLMRYTEKTPERPVGFFSSKGDIRTLKTLMLKERRYAEAGLISDAPRNGHRDWRPRQYCLRRFPTGELVIE